jgi:hypothetical protein
MPMAQAAAPSQKEAIARALTGMLGSTDTEEFARLPGQSPVFSSFCFPCEAALDTYAGEPSFMRSGVFTSSSATRWGFIALYVLCVLGFLYAISDFYRPGKGVTSLILFGRDFEARALPEVQAMERYVAKGSGYDGQFYAQLAARPRPWDPEVQAALDTPWYRAGRILPIAVASGLGLGHPDWAVHWYALQYVLVWLLLALLLARWFPPGSAWDFVCWSGCLFSAGTMMSVCRALPDVWALLLVVLAVGAWSRNRPLCANGLVGAAALAKEPAMFVALAFVDRIPKDLARAKKLALGFALAVVPFALWFGFLQLSSESMHGGRNFTLPFVGLVERWVTFFAAPATRAWPGSLDGMLLNGSVLLAITVHAVFFLLWWRPADWRWRLGAAQLPLLALIGQPVWEGYPLAAARVLSPLLFAFNLALPRTRAFAPILVVGNISILSGIDQLTHAPP